MSKNRIGIILLLLLLTVGFATVTANLIINNNANISSNPDDFSVIFYSASTDELSSAVISDDKKVITYNTKELVEVGDKSILEYEVKNNSSQYDADIDMNIIIPDSINNYIRITYEGFNNIDTTNILAKEIKAGKITIELIKPVIEDMEISIKVELNSNAVERESIAYDTYTVRFNSNGGTGEMDEQTIYYDEPTQLSDNLFTRPGYQFLGWSDNSESYDNLLSNNYDALRLSPAHTTKDLYAMWMKSDYSYVNTNQTFIAPLDGKYELEVWGAGSAGSTAAYGGYSVGQIMLTKGETLYINTGGLGGRGQPGAGGYNGGGNGATSTRWYSQGGNGATHIAMESGLLKTFSSKKNQLLVVAGGSGGVYSISGGAAGGGYSGVVGKYYPGYGSNCGGGGTQSAGGAGASDSYGSSGRGSFGQGGAGGSAADGGGGGGGLYGGGGCPDNGSGGGGSGYIGSTLLIQNTSDNIVNKMYCYGCSESSTLSIYTTNTSGSTSHATDRDTINCPNGYSTDPISKCAKSGAGHARITYINE